LDQSLITTTQQWFKPNGVQPLLALSANELDLGVPTVCCCASRKKEGKKTKKKQKNQKQEGRLALIM
jgi:hypothetical protein